MTTPTAASPDLERLAPFVGVWATAGTMRTHTPGPPVPFRATDTYEWLPGGHFLLHRFDADMPDGRVQGIEVIGYSPENDAYPMHAFDNTGAASTMLARIDTGTWTFVGGAIRFTGGFRDGETVFAGLWETRTGEDTAWRPLMDVTLSRVG